MIAASVNNFFRPGRIPNLKIYIDPTLEGTITLNGSNKVQGIKNLVDGVDASPVTGGTGCDYSKSNINNGALDFDGTTVTSLKGNLSSPFTSVVSVFFANNVRTRRAFNAVCSFSDNVETTRKLNIFWRYFSGAPSNLGFFVYDNFIIGESEGGADTDAGQPTNTNAQYAISPKSINLANDIDFFYNNILSEINVIYGNNLLANNLTQYGIGISYGFNDGLQGMDGFIGVFCVYDGILSEQHDEAVNNFILKRHKLL